MNNKFSSGNISAVARDAASGGGGVGNSLALGGATIVIGNSARDAIRIGGGASRPLALGGANVTMIVSENAGPIVAPLS